MAKLMVEMDTESKTLSVSIDGKKIKNAKSVNVWMDDNYGYLEVGEFESSDEGVHKSTRYTANASEVFTEEKEEVSESIARFLSNK